VKVTARKRRARRTLGTGRWFVPIGYYKRRRAQGLANGHVGLIEGSIRVYRSATYDPRA